MTSDGQIKGNTSALTANIENGVTDKVKTVYFRPYFVYIKFYFIHPINFLNSRLKFALAKC